MGNEASNQQKRGHYWEPDLPEGVLEVRVSVYRLELTGVGFLDKLGADAVGAYHSGVVVAGEEWGFGGHDAVGRSGVYKTAPEANHDFLFYQRVIVGQIQATATEVQREVRLLARSRQWTGPAYDLIERNCNHFSSELCFLLTGKRPPSWINQTAESLSLSRRRGQVEDKALQKALRAYCREYGEASGSGGGASPASALPALSEVPGAIAFSDAFKATFELRWSNGYDEVQHAWERCSEGDPKAHQEEVEAHHLAAAAAAAETAARVVASAARPATKARAALPVGAARAAWDDSWARNSGCLLRSWREEAAAGRLDATAWGEAERGRQVQEALTKAGDAARITLESQRSMAAAAAAKAR